MELVYTNLLRRVVHGDKLSTASPRVISKTLQDVLSSDIFGLNVFGESSILRKSELGVRRLRPFVKSPEKFPDKRLTYLEGTVVQNTDGVPIVCDDLERLPQQAEPTFWSDQRRPLKV